MAVTTESSVSKTLNKRLNCSVCSSGHFKALRTKSYFASWTAKQELGFDAALFNFALRPFFPPPPWTDVSGAPHLLYLPSPSSTLPSPPPLRPLQSAGLMEPLTAPLNLNGAG
ncbi:unnamed protein product [Pleuronectes platessa]|uniref:Uncharacterized protein n=1 Tax=Pleuronectes platessa TaxID=8262 RepID=A0A9N7V358_PLEPL|nr:unnamed protein product [Pleuronectes platessa]